METKSIFLYEEVGDTIGKVEFVESMGSDITIVNSARVSFGQHKEELDSKDLKLISYLVKHKHTSVFEHNTITFRFVLPLFVRSQHHRHRTWSYNEISRRYTDYNLQFYEPNKFRAQHKSNRQASIVDNTIKPRIRGMGADFLICQHHNKSLLLYNELLDSGICREQARGVLPQNMYTQYYGTVNLNNLLKFINLRLHEGAQWEIQKVAQACQAIATQLWPVTMNAWADSKEIACTESPI